MRRFYFDPADRCKDLVLLPLDESLHATKVLRLGVGDGVELFDGSGHLYKAVIDTMGKRIGVRLTAEIKDDSRSAGIPVTLLQAVLKAEKMDMVIQKCTELGVFQVQPCHSSRCQGRLQSGSLAKKSLRWKRIALAACKQSGRNIAPVIMETVPFADAVAEAAGESEGAGFKLMFWEEESQCSLHQIEGLEAADRITIAIGPEGGFTAEEVALAKNAGWQTVSLGNLTLRAETAALAAVSIVQFICGNLSSGK